MCEVRERIEQYGAKALTDNELLNVILGKSNRDYGNIEALSNMTILELIASGLTRSEAVKVKAIMEYSNRLWNSTMVDNSKPLSSPKNIYDRFRQRLSKLDKEQFVVVYLTPSMKYIADEVLTIGTSTASLVEVPEVLKKALINNTRNIVILHNHPSGDACPSSFDIDVTNYIKKGCDYVGIKLVDHLIISKNAYYSFSERDLL